MPKCNRFVLCDCQLSHQAQWKSTNHSMTDAIEHREMSYLIMLRESGKVILDSHPEMDRYQKLITSRGTPPAQTDQVWWSTSINAFMIYLADRHTHTHSDHNTGSAALQRNAELHIYTKNTDTITVYFKRAANISFTVTCHNRLNLEQSTNNSMWNYCSCYCY